ncbi:MAG: hypothetical protein ACI965_001847 [Paraglaciecola sp.]|jgi:hypothetical protein
MKFTFNTYLLTRSLLIGVLASTMVACGSENEEMRTLPAPASNTAPSINSSSVNTAEEGSVYSYTFSATDAQSDVLTYSASILPSWLTFDVATGSLSGTPTTADVGDHSVTLNVSDSTLSDSQSFTITVSDLAAANAAPTITSDAVLAGTVGVAYAYRLTATDLDNDTLDWSSVTLPTWGAFDTSTGILSGTPVLAGSYDAELMVSDGTDAVSQSFTIVVSEASSATLELVVFENAVLAEWALWDCCAGSTPSVETDDVEHDQVVEFDVFASPDTVQGFTARDADGAIGGTPFDAFGFSSTGTLSFEMKVVTAPAAGTPWLLKLESDDNASSTGDYALNISNEGLDPVTGEWQTYTFNLSDLSAAGLDLRAIDVFMIFPAWGQGAGAVYRIDNLYIYSNGAGDGGGSGSSTSGGSLTININDGIDFEGTETDQATWETFENGDPSAALEFVANPSMVGNTSNSVAKLTPLAADPCCGKFAGAVTRTVQSFALSSSNAAVKIWVYKDKISPVGLKFEKFNGDGYGSQGELTATNTLINQWEQLSIDFSAQIGLPQSDDITGIAIFPDMVDGRTTDTVVYLDEITFGSAADLPPPPPGEPLTIFADAANAGWPLWDCCAGSTPTVETDDADHGAVAEFSVLGSPETVQGFYSRDVGSPYSATAAGTFSFEMKIVTAAPNGTPWLLKMEADSNTSDTGDIGLNTSIEGVEPVTGVWQTYTFDVSVLAAAGLDIGAIDVVMVFPAWGQGAGAVYRIDNVLFTAGD